MIDKNLITTLFDEIIIRENSKKELSAEIKLAKENFSETNNISVTALNEGLRDYKKFLKDQDEFSVVDVERNRIVGLLYDEEITTDLIETEVLDAN